ncbi:MmcQ/YjbR family DNA-binding protein [Flavobacterium limi]|uniref:MmcQ/YjbR family DNA-binding protein n=1 Tax=Flavobacterium limi TaxID=2045105 RepID=A0ABQ1UQK0_9FLAO|nr:MmcQ/YjbR family DNA-binding protein [Flavobacterium limi]GGF22746.1 hypothetical protein GCM10011518_34970 [Flavobacterium limi]
MNIESFREYCLSLKGAKEKLPFKKATSEYDSNLLVFTVMDKWYGFVNVDTFDFCDLKCDPEDSLELQEKYSGITPGYHMNKKHWISVYFNKDVPNAKIKELVKKSYNLVVDGLTKKEKEGLAALK